MRTTAAAPTLTRRRLLLMLAAATGCGAGAAGYVRQVEPRWVAVEQLSLALPGLPPALDGKRFVQLSDIHLSEYMSPDRLAD
ncbi:MAG TPA: hypothetical protein VNK95_25800, partial [Caldilineaceae bacterium]|nr:hypothetical protein [Caldilineaceae bacterium]